MFNYPAKFAKDADGGYSVTFRDIPEAVSQGDTLAEAKAAAADALVTAMDFYFEDNRQVPKASKVQKDEEFVELPVSVATKVQLLNTMIENRYRPIDLAKAMGMKPQEINRIINVKHATKIDTIAAAFRAMGKSLELRVVPA